MSGERFSSDSDQTRNDLWLKQERERINEHVCVCNICDVCDVQAKMIVVQMFNSQYIFFGEKGVVLYVNLV